MTGEQKIRHYAARHNLMDEDVAYILEVLTEEREACASELKRLRVLVEVVGAYTPQSQGKETSLPSDEELAGWRHLVATGKRQQWLPEITRHTGLDKVAALLALVDVQKRTIAGVAERVCGQAELLSRKAEAKP